MASERPPRVSLSGDREGAYVVVEEREDGSLLIVPDRDAGRRPSRPSSDHGSGALGALIRRTPPPRSAREALEDWGVDLLDGESVSEFGMADVDDRHGFFALTDRRLLFLARARGVLELAKERPLSGISRVDPGRRGRKRWLKVTWDDSETMTIGCPDREALARLESQLRCAVPHT